MQRTLEIGQLIWKGGRNSLERRSTGQRTTSRLLGAPSSTSASYLSPGTDLQVVFYRVGSHKSKLSRAKESNLAAWKQEKDSLGKGGQSVSPMVRLDTHLGASVLYSESAGDESKPPSCPRSPFHSLFTPSTPTRVHKSDTFLSTTSVAEAHVLFDYSYTFLQLRQQPPTSHLSPCLCLSLFLCTIPTTCL